MTNTDSLPVLKVGTDWVTLEITGDAFVEMTARGYAPLVPVRSAADSKEYKMYISASSFGRALEPMRQKGGGVFRGIKFKVRKESDDRMAKYLVEQA